MEPEQPRETEASAAPESAPVTAPDTEASSPPPTTQDPPTSTSPISSPVLAIISTSPSLERRVYTPPAYTPVPTPDPIVTLADLTLSRRSSNNRYRAPLPPLPPVTADWQQQQQQQQQQQSEGSLPPLPPNGTVTGSSSTGTSTGTSTATSTSAQQSQPQNRRSSVQNETRRLSRADAPLPPAPPAPRPPPPPSPPQTQSQSSRQRQHEFVLPRWQPDSEVTYCPICFQQFSIFVRKHHCRKCGRVVCNSCSPHRITIPYPYIVQPPGAQPYQLQASGNGLTGDVSSLGGGERVRLCNPCVPDPNTAPPASATRAAATAASAGNTPNRYHSRSVSSVHNGSNQTTSSSNTFIPPPTISGQGFFGAAISPANSTFATASGPVVTPASAGQSHARHNRLSLQLPTSPQAAFTMAMRAAHAQSEMQANSQPYGSNAGANSSSTIASSSTSHRHRHHHSHSHRAPAPQIAEEDECPVCRRELPRRSLPNFEALREAHITECIVTQSQYMGGGSSSANTLSAPAPSTSLPTSPGEASTAAALASAAGAPPPPPRRTGMFPYRATEKDCVDDAECTICLEEFEVGVGMARLECFCRFHERCILAWFVKHPGCCPVHQHDSFGY
ncbi:hypothetical protein SBRCBS47491_008379 [Sporothrix bragantina]|uniref:RING-type E3 ubiquitin transferase n=1 Tax=Sporothrix bragantina TaxID=671064 RepID=A0ABP0CP37_9PEZI